MIVLLGLAVQQAPRGAAEEPGRSAGIVLKRSSAEGDLYEGEEQQGDEQAATENTAQPEIVSALPTETAGANQGDDLPKLPTPGPGPSAVADSRMQASSRLAAAGAARRAAAAMRA